VSTGKWVTCNFLETSVPQHLSDKETSARGRSVGLSWWIILAAAAWTIPWKGLALWSSARNGHRAWFVVLFLVNTLAVLEILYLVHFQKKRSGGPARSH